MHASTDLLPLDHLHLQLELFARAIPAESLVRSDWIEETSLLAGLLHQSHLHPTPDHQIRYHLPLPLPDKEWGWQRVSFFQVVFACSRSGCALDTVQ